MTRRGFLFGSLSAFTALISGCAEVELKPKKESIKYFIEESNAVYSYLRLNQKLALSKLSSIGVVFKDNLVDHTLAWYYGPNIMLSKEDLNVLVYSDSSILFFGMGLERQYRQYTKQYLLEDKKNLEKEAKNLGFKNFSEMFLTVYDRVTNFDKVEFYYMYESIKNNKINLKTLSERELFNKFMRAYKSYGVNRAYVVLNNEKVYLTIEDFSSYAVTFSIVIEMINKNIKRGSIYGL